MKRSDGVFGSHNRDALLPVNVPILAIEAGATLGWYKWAGRTGDIIGLDHFGASAPGEAVMEKLGFNVDNVVHRALQLLHRESTPPTPRTWVNAGGKT